VGGTRDSEGINIRIWKRESLNLTTRREGCQTFFQEAANRGNKPGKKKKVLQNIRLERFNGRDFARQMKSLRRVVT